MKENTTIQVNQKVLIWAREAIALNRSNASEKTGMSTKHLTQLEEGEKKPTLDELKELSKVYKRTVATLLLTNPPQEKPLPKDRRTIDSKGLGNYHEKTIMAIRKARALAVSLIDLKKDAGIAIFHFHHNASLQDKPTIIAGKLQKALNLSGIRVLENTNH